MSKLRNYVFTYNLEEDQQDEAAAREFAERLAEEILGYPCFKFAVFQLERGEESALLHLQGYIELDKPQRITYLKNNWPNFGTAHFEPRRGTQEQAIAYCKKEETRVAGPWEVGTRAQQGQRSDLSELSSKLDQGASISDLVQQHPNTFIRYGRGIRDVANELRKIRKMEETPPEKIEVIVLWGDSNSGKTETARRAFPGAYRFMPQRGSTTWWQDYDGEDVIIIDEFANNMQFHYALRLLDEWGLKVESKGGSTTIYARTIVITSMESPTEWWPGITKNRKALYRRISRCYRFRGDYPEGTAEMEPDLKPFELDASLSPWLPPEPEPEQEQDILEVENLPLLEDSFNLTFDF